MRRVLTFIASSTMSSNANLLLEQMKSVRNALLSGHASPGTPTPEDHKIANTVGYTDTVFHGKAVQAAKVQEVLEEKGFIPRDVISSEVAWFYENLGIDDTYFALESVDTIANHVMALYGAKIIEFTNDSHELNIDLKRDHEDGAVYVYSSPAGKAAPNAPQYERVMDEKYLNNSSVENAFRLETFRSQDDPSEHSNPIRCYFLKRCNFVEPIPALTDPSYRDIKAVSDKVFLSKASENTLKIYQRVMNAALDRNGPVIEMFEVVGTRERRVVIGYRMGTTSNYFSALTDLYHYYELYSSRKYVEHFSNGISIISIYLNPLPTSSAPPIEHSIYQIIKEASLIYVLPDNPFFRTEYGHAVQESAYAYVGWLFAQHFCNRLGTSYRALRDLLDDSDPHQAAVLNDIKLRFREETFTRQSIYEVIKSLPHLVRLLYVHFANIHYPRTATDKELIQTISVQRLSNEKLLSDEQLESVISKETNNSHERLVFLALLSFNRSVLKTNFYTPTKVALSFRLDPSFLPEVEYPVRPYGIFFVVGAEFRGFHVRFRDVARGGIRVIRSRNRENYSINQRTLFDENYNLALTQNLKNKDIPEGGAKGTILPDIDTNPRIAFQKYVDALLDLMIPGSTPGIKEAIVDLHGKEEILFLGPDEGTAEFMDWGAYRARERGASWWKSFTTGKSAATLGGVPHDVFGMTSRSVRAYKLGIYKHLGLREEDVTKVQTGGPDGDLGSNEILLSSDKTIAIIDGSGVVWDLEGLNREELVRLAKARKTVSHFDTSKLSKQGFRVLVDERDVTLPSGEHVMSGFTFRNLACRRFKADIFVPCGGRPETINVNEVQVMCPNGTSPYKYIVEGANLFITRTARVDLEKRGVILYPDASANKGGVTSSSLEVLVGLSLTDKEYMEWMCYKNGEPTPFYLGYVRDIQYIIERNAAAEFEAIWRENELTGRPRSVISTDLSTVLNDLSQQIEGTSLYDQEHIRRAVLAQVFPKTLVEAVGGLEELEKRVPSAYLRSAFAAQLAAGFVYAKGPRASHVDFFNHITSLTTA